MKNNIIIEKIDSLIDYIDNEADIRKEFRWKHFKINFESLKEELKNEQ